MKPLRILLVSSAPLAAEYGAGQIASELASALAERGHEVDAWWPGEDGAARSAAGWHRAMRQAVVGRAERGRSFDVVDLPAPWLSRRLAATVYTVSRSVQPDLLYLEAERRGRAPRSLAHRFYHAASRVIVRRSITAGWKHAARILCLGTLERDWMRARFPAWSAKLGHYFAAPPRSERELLRQLAANRQSGVGRPVRWLWIGRWSAHKGPQRLLALIRERWQATADSFTVAGCGALPEGSIESEWLDSGRVRVVEHFSRDELLRLLAEHEAGLMTSDVEGWGLSLQEMLESGMPVWATRAGAVPDLEAHFPALLFPFPPPVEMRAIAPRREPKAVYFEELSWEAIAARYEAVVRADLEARAAR